MAMTLSGAKIGNAVEADGVVAVVKAGDDTE